MLSFKEFQTVISEIYRKLCRSISSTELMLSVSNATLNKASLFFLSLTVFPFKRTGDPFGPCRKIGQGQPRVIINIYIVEIGSLMLHAKFQDHRTSGPGNGVYHIWAWQPPWSCYLNHFYQGGST